MLALKLLFSFAMLLESRTPHCVQLWLLSFWWAAETPFLRVYMPRPQSSAQSSLIVVKVMMVCGRDSETRAAANKYKEKVEEPLVVLSVSGSSN